MKYSEAMINDDNFDQEHEKFCEIVGHSHVNDVDFYEELPYGFSEQAPDSEWPFTTYVKSKTMPNKGSDFRQAFQVGEIAVEFGNGFMSKSFESIL